MIISRTPFRVSLAGGGSDFAEYYRVRPGNVITLAINRYMYVTVNRRFDDSIRVAYTRTEIVDHIDDLEHDLIREALRMVGYTRGIEVTTIADLPAGIGLGSSSSLAVGALNALYALKGEWRSPEELARRACEIEIEVLGRPIGKQDQYIAAFGGLCDIHFLSDDTVTVNPLICPPDLRRRLIDQLMLFYTGTSRQAHTVLGEVRKRLVEHDDTRSAVDGLVEIAACTRQAILDGRLDRLGELLDRSWQLKRQMASKVTNGRLDVMYAEARAAGATGGKVSGAGGGGCLLLVVPEPHRSTVRAAMERAGLKEVPFSLEPEGSRIIHYAV
jgi:D-glycero-alpha-D-manno-heptose-7-phosphate kinase